MIITWINKVKKSLLVKILENNFYINHLEDIVPGILVPMPWFYFSADNQISFASLKMQFSFSNYVIERPSVLLLVKVSEK